MEYSSSLLRNGIFFIFLLIKIEQTIHYPGRIFPGRIRAGGHFAGYAVASHLALFDGRRGGHVRGVGVGMALRGPVGRKLPVDGSGCIFGAKDGGSSFARRTALLRFV